MGLSVLVVDDEPTFQLAIKYALTIEGASVDGAGDAASGLSLAMRNAYDLIMVDLQMPLTDGIGFLRSLRESGNTTTAILMGSHLAAENIVRCARWGVVDFLEKPLTPDRLSRAVRRVLLDEGGSFSRMLEAGRKNEWEKLRGFLSALERPKREAWEIYVALATGKIEPGKSFVGRSEVFRLMVFES